MRWLITGARGQLGTHLAAHLTATSDDHVTAVSRHDLDITDATAVHTTVRAARPDVIINAAAYTAVDAAETNEPTAYRINATAVNHLGHAAHTAGARLIHVSTDYVFDGEAHHPYEPDDPTGPRTAYGRTKLAGEHAAHAHGAHIVRTAWVYGGPGANFVHTMLRLATERPTIDVVDDQIGSPTNVADLATALIELARSPLPPTLLHYTNTGQTSWYELARAILAYAGHDPDRIHPVTSHQFPRPAPRPQWSVLSTNAWTAAGLTPPAIWEAAMTRSLAQQLGARPKIV